MILKIDAKAVYLEHLLGIHVAHSTNLIIKYLTMKEWQNAWTCQEGVHLFTMLQDK
jgi:hypothetical protein